MVNPAWRLIRYFTPEGWRYFYCLRELNNFAFSVIQEWRAAIDAGRDDDGNLLSMYLNKDTYKTGEHDDTFMAPTDNNLRDVILNIIIAGRDTTANALCWAFYRICIHPEVQQKLREEAVRVLSTGVSKDTITYDQLSELKYTEAFVMEVLRLHPSVPKEGKTAQKDDILPDGTPIKRGDLVVFSPWVMGRDSSLWENPLDFTPDRFLGTPKPSPFVFTAFQAGPRICLGQNFAIIEIKTCIAKLLSKFEFSIQQDPSTICYDSSLTLPMKGGILLSAKPLGDS